MRVQRDAAGVPQRLFALFTDITDAERDNTAIRASEARYRLVADAAEVGILEYDLDTGRAAWTPHLWEIFGLPPHPDGLDFAGIVALAHPDDRESLSDAFAAARQDAATDRATIVFRILRPDGAIRHLAFFTIGVRDEAGILRKIHAVVSDITSPREACMSWLPAKKLECILR